MPKIKVRRQHISLDMTAMCDMAFLLLTFFMLTTKFTPEEEIEVVTPGSISETKIPEKSLMVISVDKQGKVFIGVAEEMRRELIHKVLNDFKIQLSEKQMILYSEMGALGASRSQISRQMTSKSSVNKINQFGIPCDSTNNELAVWVQNALEVNPKLKFAIKGDKEVNYEVVDKVITTLQDQNINKFNLITSMKIRQN